MTILVSFLAVFSTTFVVIMFLRKDLNPREKLLLVAILFFAGLALGVAYAGDTV